MGCVSGPWGCFHSGSLANVAIVVVVVAVAAASLVVVVVVAIVVAAAVEERKEWRFVVVVGFIAFFVWLRRRDILRRVIRKGTMYYVVRRFL